jgi:four helix bundle protein
MSRGKGTFPKKMVKFSKEGNSEMLTEDELVETMENERHRKLNVWREAVSLAREIYEHTATFPPEERFGLSSQLRRAAVSVASNIAEGSKRLPQDNQHFLRYALGSLAECDTQLIIAEQLGYATYAKKLKAEIMSLTMGIRAYGKTL